jgi:type IV pilus assembly protein PilN
MRPINLLPPEDRRDGQAPTRTGQMPYILVGALVLLLIGVTALVLAGNQVSEREADVTRLKHEDAQESARADRLAAYTQFQTLHEQRVATVTSLANSRFDWERVMRELSLILPENAWLVEVSASASPGTDAGGSGGGSGLRSGSPGPALELSGCAAGQEAVAGFVTALKDIDGVTRVGVQSSELGSSEAGAGIGEEGGSGGGGDDCRTRDFIAKFEIVVVFDAAPVPVGASDEEAAAPVTTPAGAASTTEEASEDTSESSGEEG